MDINSRITDITGYLTLSGRFDFSAHRNFRTATDEVINNPKVKALDLDLGQVNYIDSSALGMLLLLNERCKAAGKTVVLSNCQGTVRQVLEVAHLDRVFSLQ